MDFPFTPGDVVDMDYDCIGSYRATFDGYDTDYVGNTTLVFSPVNAPWTVTLYPYAVRRAMDVGSISVGGS